MKKNKIVESQGNTFYLKGRGIPKGCQFCLKGAKTVLFLNGFCQKPNQCSWYCPISMERRNTDNTFANEIQITRREDLIEENKKIYAKGMSITGGDPLLDTNIEKTIDYIKYVKSIEFFRNPKSMVDGIKELYTIGDLIRSQFNRKFGKFNRLAILGDNYVSFELLNHYINYIKLS